jgi:hypothetical protein
MLAYSADSTFWFAPTRWKRVAVEAVARSQVGDPPRSDGVLRAVEEPHQLAPVVRAQKRGLAGHARAARVQLRREVDLVQLMFGKRKNGE